MKLSQMVNKENTTVEENETLETTDIVSKVIDDINGDTTNQNTNRPEGHLQSQLTDGDRGTAADISEEEMEFIKQIANPALTPAEATPQEDQIDDETAAHLAAMKDLIS
jgi:hypothetical protein